MSGLYGGRPSQVTFTGPLTITAVSNTNPVQITVGAGLPASFFTGGAGYGSNPAKPRVNVIGVQGCTSANGVWDATPISGTVFTIPVAGNGAYTTGGTVQPLDMQGTPTVPVDGDPDNSASIASWAQDGLDRVALVSASIGVVKQAGRAVLAMGAPTTVAHDTGTTTAGTWKALFADNSLNVLAGSELGTLSIVNNPSGGAFAVYGFEGLAGIDNVEAIFEGVAAGSSGVAGDSFGLWWQATAPGAAAPTSLGTMTLLTESVRAYLGQAAPMRSSGFISAAFGGSTSVLWIAPAYLPGTTGGSITYSIGGGMHLQVRCSRLTLVPQ